MSLFYLPQPPQYPHRIVSCTVHHLVNTCPKTVLTIYVLVQNGSPTTCRPRFQTCGFQPLALLSSVPTLWREASRGNKATIAPHAKQYRQSAFCSFLRSMNEETRCAGKFNAHFPWILFLSRLNNCIVFIPLLPLDRVHASTWRRLGCIRKGRLAVPCTLRELVAGGATSRARNTSPSFQKKASVTAYSATINYHDGNLWVGGATKETCLTGRLNCTPFTDVCGLPL